MELKPFWPNLVPNKNCSSRKVIENSSNAPCPDLTETQPCDLTQCCKYTEWGDWENCINSCGDVETVVQMRHRLLSSVWIKEQCKESLQHVKFDKTIQSDCSFRCPVSNCQSECSFRCPVSNCQSECSFRCPVSNCQSECSFRCPVSNCQSKCSFRCPVSYCKYECSFRCPVSNCQSDCSFRCPVSNCRSKCSSYYTLLSSFIR